MYEEIEQKLIKVIKIVDDYLPHVVLGGGWAALVYYRFIWMKKETIPLQTKDFDFIVNNRVPITGETKLKEKLTSAGLISKPLSSMTSDSRFVRFEDEEGDLTIEFLTDRQGICT